MRSKLIFIVLIISILSTLAMARINIGLRIVISGTLIPTISLGYEHESGHGLEITTGVLPGGEYKFLLRGEIGYVYRYQNIIVGIGRGITRYGAEGFPVFDDHIKFGYQNNFAESVSYDIGTTLSLGVTGQGLAFWGGVNKHY